MSKGARKIGLALGSGGARGWAHIGALKALFEMGIRPDVVTGASIGAIVGAMVAAGVFETFAQEVERLDWMKLARFFAEVRIPRHGLLSGQPVLQWLNRKELLGGRTFDSLELPFAVAATDLYAEQALVLREGPVVEAVRASFSIPGVFDPVLREGKVLIDGGFTNPVPVDAARALGADVVIAIDINIRSIEGEAKPRRFARSPAMLPMLLQTARMVENRISRQTLHESPADLLLCLATGQIQTLDFYGGRSAMKAGAEEVLAHQADLRRLLD